MNKAALNRNGHIVFSFSLAVIILFILKQYIELPDNLLRILAVHMPVYLAFSLFPDLLARGGRGLVAHRFNITHSRGLLYILIVVSIYLIYVSIDSPRIILEVANKHTLILSAVLGYISHLLGDSLTSPLPRRLF